MLFFRMFTGVSAYIVAIAALVYALDTKELMFFFISVICFIVAYAIWPSKKRGQREGEHAFFDILEFIVMLPTEIVLWFFRLIARLLFSKNDGLDIDI